ncbi:MAG: GreA/GreB family elongation factor [Spirochaetia bacterium]|jgi:regulator of nucleoside diphosphate kinase|nr:GreA/GreB family elongation factor [Spirochaetia bacterium]
MAKKIVLFNSDYKKLVKLIQVYKESNRLKSKHLLKLADELKNAKVIADNIGEIQKIDAVSINSTVSYKNLDTGEVKQVTVVFPADTGQDLNKVSILSPLGTALIGEEEKNLTYCLAPEGQIPLQIEKIISKQMQTAGN